MFEEKHSSSEGEGGMFGSRSEREEDVMGQVEEGGHISQVWQAHSILFCLLRFLTVLLLLQCSGLCVLYGSICSVRVASTGHASYSLGSAGLGWQL